MRDATRPDPPHEPEDAVTTPLQSATLLTPAGPFTLLAGPEGVVAAGFTTDSAALRRLLRGATATAPPVEGADAAARAFAAYFAGELDALAGLPVAAAGTAHQERTWAALRDVPAGERVTYGELAARTGSGARAAGSACGRNPACVVVPCHRVVRADGGLGGYLWGTPAKRWLLDHERRHAGNAPLTPASRPPRPRARARTPAAARRS